VGRIVKRRSLAAVAAGLLFLAGCAAPPRRREIRVPPPEAKAVVRTARSYLPEEGGDRPVPNDCSDFVRKVFSEHGFKLPRTAAEMSLLGERIRSSRELSMGDLVFFSGARVSRIVGHVAIYINNGIFIHVSRPEDGVRMESLYSDYYRRRYIRGGRLIP
jgi:hypothetical protein